MSSVGVLFPRELQAKEIFRLGSNRMYLSVAETVVTSVECAPYRPVLNFSELLTNHVARLFRLLSAVFQHHQA